MTQDAELGLYVGFEGYRSATESDLADAIKASLVVLDTNVLLNLYNYQGTALDDFTRVFDALGDRLFIPHQVMDEFWRNRRTVLSENQGRHREQAEIEKAFDSVESAFRKWYQRVVDRNGSPPADAVRELEEARSAITDYMGQRNVAANIALPDTPTHEDRILQRLEPIVRGRVGPAPNAETIDQLRAQGKVRVAAKIPPGYMDSEKSPERAIGDFLVWHQTMAAAQRHGLPVLMVTQDQKEDWWADRGTKSMRARPELVSELLAQTGQQLLMIRAHDLVRLGSYLGVTVSQSTVAEAEMTSSEDVNGWNDELIGVYLKVLEGWPQHHEIFCEAIRSGGEISRARMAAILGRRKDDGMTGVGKPYYTALRRVSAQELTDIDPVVPLVSHYELGGYMSSFVMPTNLVPIFQAALASENGADVDS